MSISQAALPEFNVKYRQLSINNPKMSIRNLPNGDAELYKFIKYLPAKAGVLENEPLKAQK
jgi:hypothetical protein